MRRGVADRRRLVSKEPGKLAGPLSGAGMQKMWKQLGSESRGSQSPEVTKGFAPGEFRVEVGGSGPLIAMVGL